MPDERAKANKPRRLSDVMVQNFTHAKKGKRYAISDSACPGLRVRITDRGHKAFLIWKRLEGRQFWTTRYLGTFPAMGVEEARKKARAWLSQIAEGKDPKAEAKREARTRLDRATFRQAALDFIAQKLPGERRRKEVADIIYKTLIPEWGDTPLVEITRRDVVELIRGRKLAGKVGMARTLLVLAKRMFSWFVAQEVYALDASPCSEIKATALLGEAATKDRTLSEDELRALWKASGEEAFPVQQVYRMLMFNGLRLREVTHAMLTEFDFGARDWVIAKERMKGKEHKARAHLVPLTSASLGILGQMVNLAGPYLFSVSAGKKPITMPQRIKRRIDERMLKALRQMAEDRGDDPEKAVLPAWTNHDIRRSVRSELSKLRDRRGHKFPEEVKEAVIAHAKSGIVGTYDKYNFAQEKYEALDAWAVRLQEIINERPSVIVLAERKRA